MIETFRPFDKVLKRGFTYGAPYLNYGAGARNLTMSKQNLQAHGLNLNHANGAIEGVSDLFILSNFRIPEPPVPQVLMRSIPAAV